MKFLIAAGIFGTAIVVGLWVGFTIRDYRRKLETRIENRYENYLTHKALEDAYLEARKQQRKGRNPQ